MAGFLFKHLTRTMANTHLTNKKILLGVAGSIAAYKATLITRLLVKAGAEVRVVMTDAAKDFITPLTLSTLSKNPVYSNFVDSEGALWNNHVDLGLWADVLLIAPASANTMAKMANGICDNLITAVYLSAKCPVLVAPAMDRDMWLHPSTQNNIRLLESYGNQVIPAEDGELASGLYGVGRLAEPENIITFLEKFFEQGNASETPASETNTSTTKLLTQDLVGKTVIITAGPTREPFDPVRFISNHSTGKMGIALAEEITERGGKVQLVLGPTNLRPTNPAVEVISVMSAEDMFQAVDTRFANCNWAIMAAAVADFTPETASDEKIKKTGKDDMVVRLKRTKDILKTMGGRKAANQKLIGFALETQNGRENALKKLKSKNADCIVLNSPKVKGAGFKHDTNKVTILDKNGGVQEYELKSKRLVAKDIIDYVLANL